MESRSQALGPTADQPELQVESSPGQAKTWLIRFGLVLLVCLLVVTVGEIVLRAFGFSYPRTSVRDPHRGTARCPGMEWWQKEEGSAYIKINQDGFRDRYHNPAKPPSTVRIAVLGDSVVEALQVAQEDRVTEQLERELNERRCFGANKVEVMNFGISGYGTVQELMTLRHCVWKFEPDIVLLGFMTGNDFRNNSRALQNDPGRPYFIIKEGQLVFDDSFRDSPDHLQPFWKKISYKCIDTSRVLQMIYRTKMLLEKRRELAASRARFKDVPAEIGLDSMIYREPSDPSWKDAWNVTEALLAQMSVEVRSKGAEFLVVTLTNAIQVDPDSSAREQFMKRLNVESLSYADERIKAVGEREGIAVLNLAPALSRYAEEHKVYLHGFTNTEMGKGHWNEHGHSVAAQMIADKLCRNPQTNSISSIAE